MRDTFDSEIVVTWNEGRGRMIIYRDKAFSASASWLNKWLKKIVALDYRNETEILKDLNEYLAFNVYRMNKELEEYKASFPEKAKALAHRYNDAIEEKVRLETLSKTKKYPNGARCPKDKLPTKRELTTARAKVKSIESEYKDLQKEEGQILRKAEAYKKNLIIIHERLSTIIDKTCYRCGFNDPDMGCTCPSLDKWYACPLEPEPTEEDFITVEEAIQ